MSRQDVNELSAELYRSVDWSSSMFDAEAGILTGKRYLIHDRDPLFTAEFLRTLEAAGVKSVKLPPRSPKLNPHAERFVRSVFVTSIEESCLDRMIFFGDPPA